MVDDSITVEIELADSNDDEAPWDDSDDVEEVDDETRLRQMLLAPITENVAEFLDEYVDQRLGEHVETLLTESNELVQQLEVFSHKQEDAIDFPCSPAFVTHYAAQGLTTDYPPEYYRGRELAVLREELAELREIVQKPLPLSPKKEHQLQAQLNHLMNRLYELERKRGNRDEPTGVIPL